MSNCDYQKNINEDEAATADKEPISFGDRLLITTLTSAAAVLFFILRALGTGQQGALLTSMSLVSLCSCQRFFDRMIKNLIQ